MKRTVIAVITILLFAALLSGCVAAQPPGAAPAAQPAGEAASQPAAGGAQKLIWSVEGVNELPGLDPANPQNAQSVQAINLIFGGLVKLDDQLNVVPDGAESWTVSEDGKTYTFTIREGLKFADGTPVTAQNFADSINRALQPETASYGASFQLGHIVGAADVAAGTAKEASGHQGGGRAHARDHARRQRALLPGAVDLSSLVCRADCRPSSRIPRAGPRRPLAPDRSRSRSGSTTRS